MSQRGAPPSAAPAARVLVTRPQPEAQQWVERLNAVLGVLGEADAGPLEAEIEARIALRQQARLEKNFARADEIRAELKKQGIVLIDTPGGVKWKKE